MSAEYAQLCQAIWEWQASQFPHATNASRAAHMLKEVKELVDDPDDLEEVADIVMLAIGMCRERDLLAALWAKLDKNKNRTWGDPDENGVVEHVD